MPGVDLLRMEAGFSSILDASSLARIQRKLLLC